MTQIQETQEGKRLAEELSKTNYWKRWGSYLSDRQWGTVREDDSADGRAWDYFPHDHARSRAYRWGEDGIAGISDDRQLMCFAIALWNGEDDILKERLFGLTNGEGNHGEDVKEYYFYLDNTPTHSYMKCLYKYPQGKFPYSQLVNHGRGRSEPEYELLDTDIFKNDRYFDVFVEYAKNAPEDILIQISVVNRGPERKTLHLLPTLWFRNTWSWYFNPVKPSLKARGADQPEFKVIEASSPDQDFGKRWLYCEGPQEVLYTENETNKARFEGGANAPPYVKDAFEQYILHGHTEVVNPQQSGTKAAAYYTLDLDAGETKTVRLRLSNNSTLTTPFGPEFAAVFQDRKREADEFYQAVTPFPLSEDMRNVQRQAFAGLLWSKQFYYYVVKDWLKGDPVSPPPPEQRKSGRNHEWVHLNATDILSIPDTWEYPWFAAWDLAFHTIPLALIDPAFAKRQLWLLTREWYMHPNGQIPAYEWAFNDVNPPVHAWATWRVYKIEEEMYGHADREFLEQVFQKLALYFTWWVNRKDLDGNNLFAGGFLGLDNIGPFDRNAIPGKGSLEQADGTSWMGMYCLNMLRIALELAMDDPSYQEMARKFFQHFLYLADAMNQIGGEEADLWSEEDGFYYDILHLTGDWRINGKQSRQMKVRSMVGLVPLFAVETIDPNILYSPNLADFRRRFHWFLQEHPDLTQGGNITIMPPTDEFTQGYLLSLLSEDKLKRILHKMLDENEFLSPHGIRSLSKYYEHQPYILPEIRDEQGHPMPGQPYQVDYEPAESRTGDFGGNSNWRGPVWFPVNFLIIESLQKFHRYWGENLTVECPKGSGKQTLWEVATELSNRLIHIFLRDVPGNRPVYGGTKTFQENPNWRDLILFYEYFHGDNGAGLGASHQTGWTGVVAKLIQQWGEYPAQGRTPQFEV